MIATSAQRRASRNRRTAARLARLAEIDVQPAPAAEGRVITVAVRSEDGPPSDALARYLRPWWSTVHRIGLRGAVLHAGWSPDALAAVETPRIDAVAVSPGARHIFHERHFLVRDFLRTIDDPCVFITDGSDVAFKRDPFELVRQSGTRRLLYVGRERRRILFCRCVRREMRRVFGRVWFPLRPVLNPGILGGRREVVLEALESICGLIAGQGDGIDASDMCFVNRALHASFGPREIVTGPPLHSRFKRWEFETSAAILHK